jgi:hypothetical protein
MSQAHSPCPWKSTRRRRMTRRRPHAWSDEYLFLIGESSLNTSACAIPALLESHTRIALLGVGRSRGRLWHLKAAHGQPEDDVSGRTRITATQGSPKASIEDQKGPANQVPRLAMPATLTGDCPVRPGQQEGPCTCHVSTQSTFRVHVHAVWQRSWSLHRWDTRRADPRFEAKLSRGIMAGRGADERPAVVNRGVRLHAPPTRDPACGKHDHADPLRRQRRLA